MTASKKYSIRLARPTDAAFLVRMFRDFLAEVNNDCMPPVDEGDCMLWMVNVIRKGATWVAIADKDIVGTIGMNVCPYDWNAKAWHAFDEWFYVKPRYRKGYDIAARLVDEAKSKADEAGLPVIFSINSGKDVRADRFLQMQGFRRVGGILARAPGGSANG